jgi:hypothetical protein
MADSMALLAFCVYFWRSKYPKDFQEGDLTILVRKTQPGKR